MSSSTEIERTSPLLTAKEAAEYLRVHVDSLHRWRYLRTGPKALKVGRELRYRVSDLDEWAERMADAS